MPDFWIKQNDTAPAIEAQLQDKDGNAIDISGASVDFHMEHKHGDESDVVDAGATINDASSGKVQYNWQTGDTSTPGDYLAEWEVTYSDGSIESFPNNDEQQLEVRIEPEVA